jgi:hypothetical protein
MGALQAHQRVGVFLGDTLAEPGAAAPEGKLGFVADNIRTERHEADRIKQRHPILAIIGNPPYRRLLTEKSANSSATGWMNFGTISKGRFETQAGGTSSTLFQNFRRFLALGDLENFRKRGCAGPGRRGVHLEPDLSAGKPYAGMRKMLRERFDRIEIIDLRGDVRRGERAGVDGDQGVFNIQVGTAITLAIADRSKAGGELADVSYIDSWAEGLFSRDAKLNWLMAGSETGTRPGAVDIERNVLDDMKREPFQNGEWPSLSSCFLFWKSGVKTQNDPALVKVIRSDLQTDVRPLIALRHDPPYQPNLERQVAYRLSTAAGFTMILALYAMPFATGAGPAVWCHGLLPDYHHAFRGSYGGYAFPLRDNRPGHGAHSMARWTRPPGLPRAFCGGTTRLYQVIFPQMAHWLPDAEVEQLRSAFRTELEG